MACAPNFKERHRHERIKWTTEHLPWTQQEWSEVIFSGKKKSNLDGSDGFAFNWHETLK